MKFLPLFSLFILLFFSCTKSRTVWLDELDLSNADQATGITRANQSMWRTPLVIASDTFARGIGTHAFGVIRVQLDGKTNFFEALVGVDDSAPEGELKQSSVEFVVIGDGHILWRSGIMHGGDKAKRVTVSLKGISSLILRTDHAGDGIVGDRADWVNAKFEFVGKAPYTVQRKREADYIRTPKAPVIPLINAPYRYGACPGNSILFTIPVSGERPMNFTIADLPSGLSLDSSTGIVTGKIDVAGVYNMKVTATNVHGTDCREIIFEIGDKLALTPPMGWNSWNVFGADISDEKIRKMADAMVDLGLTNYGYAYINIDDGWQGQRGGKYNAVMPNEKFPDMKALVDYVHSKGLKIGIYSSPWVQTFAGYVGGSADTPDGKVINSSRRVGKYSFTKNDVKQWAEWGFDYLKYDWCSYGGVLDRDLDKDPYSVSSLAFQGGGDSIAGRKPFKIMGDYLRKQPRDIVYNLCQYGMGDVWKWGDAVGGQCWRTTNDITDTWESVKGIALSQDRAAAWAKPGNWNDPDMLVLGIVGWGNPHQTKLKPDEQYLHFSLWSLFSAPLLIGCDLEKMDDFTLSLLTNNEVIAVNQDPLGKQATCVYSIGELRIYVKELEDGSKAVGFCNFDREKADISFRDFDKLNITGKQTVRDLWRQKDIKTLDTGRKPLSLNVPAHGVLLYKFTPVQ